MEKIGDIRVGTNVCNLEILPGKGGQYIRAAGTTGTIIKKDGDKVQIKLPSGALLDVKTGCKVLRGRIGNEEHRNKIIGKAGRNR
jgi:large subunit ribosomal protein L2